MRGILKKQGYGDGSVGKAFSCACLRIRVQIPRTQEKLDAGVHICHPSAPATKWSVETGERVSPEAHQSASLEKRIKGHLKQGER